MLGMGLAEWGWDWLRELSGCLLSLLGGKDEPLISLIWHYLLHSSPFPLMTSNAFDLCE